MTLDCSVQQMPNMLPHVLCFGTLAEHRDGFECALVADEKRHDMPDKMPDPNPPASRYAISRLCSPGGFWYWAVAFRRRGKAYFKSFYDVRRGGSELSLAAAIAWRDEQLARLQALGKRDFCQLLRSTNSSGEPGVQFIRQVHQPQGSWQARHKLPDGRQITRTFAVKKHGEREAFRLAVQAPHAMLESVEDTPLVHHPEAKIQAETAVVRSSKATDTML